MRKDEELPEYNPYAVPESVGPPTERAVREPSLAPGQDFRVFGRQLICRKHARFANVCWLTGSNEVSIQPVVWKAKLAPAFWDSWWIQLPLILLLLGVSAGNWPSWAVVAVFFLAVAQGLFVKAVGEPFKMSTGQSADAIQNEKRIRWFWGIQISVCVTIVMWIALEANNSPVLIWMFSATWFIASIVYWFRSGLTCEAGRWLAMMTNRFL